MAVHQVPDAHRVEAEAALDVLCDAALDPVVDMVCRSVDGAYEVRSHDGRTTFRRAGDGFERLTVEGRDPIADQSTAKFSPLVAERAHPQPHRSENAYPFAFEHIAQLFDSPAAPDLCVLHSAAHNWEEAGGHLGEHGSLGVIQARAPFVVGGKGVKQLGFVERAAQLVDVAPTVAALLGCAPRADGTYVGLQDGNAIEEILDLDDRPQHVIGFLFDGTNANVLYDMVRRGEAPNVAALIEQGVAFEHGAMAAMPTVTLANHTSIITGAYPGHHGVLHNAWYDLSTGAKIITNSSATWPWCMEHLDGRVETIHDAVHRTWPEAFTASVNEPCDKGATYSTFDFFRRGEIPPIPRDPFGLPHTTERFVRPSKDYSWSSVIDHMGTEQAIGILGGHYRDVDYPAPRFMWCNFTLTDAAMHEGGPYSEMAAAAVRDSDGRLGEIVEATKAAGIFDDCAFLLVADHGMEENDPTCRGDWDEALRAAGIDARDEAYGFLYFGVPRT
jgi:predicted AlkP superfamily pyrophosphatase or phosphodiesterase